MNKKILLLLSIVLFPAIMGMDARLRARVHQWEREQAALKKAEEKKQEEQDCLTPRLRAMLEQWEHEQAVEKKEKQSLSTDMTLTNGYQVSFNFFLDECRDLDKLRKNDYEKFAELVKKVQNADYEIKSSAVVEYFKEEYLLLPDGTVQESVRNILLWFMKKMENHAL